MNRRSFLHGLLALPFIGPAMQRVQPHLPWMGVHSRIGMQASSSSYLGGGKIPIGTVHKYTASAWGYGEVGGITIKQGESIKFKYIRTG